MALTCASLPLNPNQHQWNAIIKRKLTGGDFNGCINSFIELQSAGFSADNFTFPLLLKAAALRRSSTLGPSLHGQTFKTGFFTHLFVQTALINMYSHVGRLSDARKVFDRMSQRDAIAWNSILAAYASYGMADLCLEIFNSMPVKDLYSFNIMISCFASSGRVENAQQIFNISTCKDDFSWNSLISSYVKAGEMDRALHVFDEMPQKNSVSWNIVISGYLQSEQYAEVIQKFFEMKSFALAPGELAMASAIAASAHLGSLRLGTELHLQAHELGLTLRPHVAAALIDMYAKCGSIASALMVFYKTEAKDVYAWNSMISGLGKYGYGRASIELFEEMKREGAKPDGVTFVGLLGACSHSGLVGEGYQLFVCMKEEYGVSPSSEHYSCVVDMLSRAGELGRAHEIVKGIGFDPGVGVLGALLNGCVIHRNVEIGMAVAEMIAKRGDEMSDGEYMMLASMCDVGGYHEEGMRWREKMREKGVVKKAGLSMIEVDGEMRRFRSGNMESSNLFESRDNAGPWGKLFGSRPNQSTKGGVFSRMGLG